MIRADLPNNENWGGVCIFYKEILGVCVTNLSNFSESIICEVSIQNSEGYIVVV